MGDASWCWLLHDAVVCDWLVRSLFGCLLQVHELRERTKLVPDEYLVCLVSHTPVQHKCQPCLTTPDPLNRSLPCLLAAV